MNNKTSTAGVLAAILFAGSAYWYMQQNQMALSSKNWPTTKGTVSVSLVPNSPRHCGRDDLHHLDPYYTYSVGGESYTSESVFIGRPECIGPRLAQKSVDRYPVGKIVDV